LVRDRVKRGGGGHGTNGGGNGRWEEVDASGTREEVEARIWRLVGEVVEMEKGPVGRLWMDEK
jgi:hypothetical protein